MLKGLWAAPRAVWSASFNICSKMQKRKMDLPVALYLLHYTDESDCNANPPIDDGARSSNMTLPKHNLAANGGSEVSSSIFDSFDVPSKGQKAPNTGTVQSVIQVTSSIINSFDVVGAGSEGSHSGSVERAKNAAQPSVQRALQLIRHFIIDFGTEQNAPSP